MTVLSLKQVESNFGKKEPCERDSSWIIKFFHCLDFGCRKYGIIIFSIRTQNGCTRCTHKEKICEVNNFLYFFKKSEFHFNVFSRGVKAKKSKNFRRSEPWSRLREIQTLGS